MRRTIITATAALLAVSACTTGDDAGGTPERLAHAVEAMEALPDDERIAGVRVTADHVELMVPEAPAFRARIWNAETQAFEDGEQQSRGGVDVAASEVPWDDVWQQLAEGTEDCADQLTAEVTPLRAGETAVTTSCTDFTQLDARNWLVGEELASLDDMLAPASVGQLLEELAVVVDDFTLEHVQFQRASDGAPDTFLARVVLDDGTAMIWSRALQGSGISFFFQGSGNQPKLSPEELDADAVNAAIATAAEQAGGVDAMARVTVGELGMAFAPGPRLLAADEEGTMLAEVPLQP